ncbi:hypothetical protein F2Q70_00017966 [Brassica cretica]|uniref:Uncharacterized protein n=1 Tax=Brassica cretica TaxID=69181 RepID=A0A8S9I5X6_BRACR|nr:hypothetical protein F2Q70_00017966 [Brassica cretica]KAF2599271.1 hypothetical protein F2Q68_00011619 [Brassica cretica]
MGVKGSMRFCSICNLYMQEDMWSTMWIGQARGVAMHATRPCGQTCGGPGVSLHGARLCIQTGRGCGVILHETETCSQTCGARAIGNIPRPATDKSEYEDQNTDELSSVNTQLPHMHAVRSLRSDRAFVPFGRYVAKLGRYVTTERDRALPKQRYDIGACILVYHLMLSPEDRSKPISCFPPF